jgi:hypothetical protein
MRYVGRLESAALLALALGSASLAACDSEEGGPAALVGEWKRYDESDPTKLRDQFTFGADGSYAFDEFYPDNEGSNDHVVGTYTATDDTLVVVGTNRGEPQQSRISTTYYVNGELYAPSALVPVGDTSGIVGSWHSFVDIEDLDENGAATPTYWTDTTYRFGDDDTVHMTYAGRDGSIVSEEDGTYLEESPDHFAATFTVAPGSTVTFHVRLVDGAALAGITFQR